MILSSSSSAKKGKNFNNLKIKPNETRVIDTKDIDSDSTDDIVNPEITASTLFTALASRVANTDYTATNTSNTSSTNTKKRSIESKNNEIKKKQNKNEILSDTVLVAGNNSKNEHKLFIHQRADMEIGGGCGGLENVHQLESISKLGEKNVKLRCKICHKKCSYYCVKCSKPDTQLIYAVHNPFAFDNCEESKKCYWRHQGLIE